MKHYILLITLFFICESQLFAQGTTYYVTTTGAGAKNGLNWGDAFEGLQAALNVAVSSDEIWVAAGTYKPTQDYDLGDESNPRLYHFRMINGVAIYGGFAGTEISIGERDNYGLGEANETILSGDLNNNGYDNSDSYHVFFHPNGLGLTSSAVLDGFTIKGGNADGPSHTTGGGMYNDASSPTLTNCTFTSNRADDYGGGMYNLSSSPIITNCIFTLNETWNFGGGMYNDSSSPTITNCLFTSNSANFGGGMNNNSSNATLTNCTFTSNSASENGGGLSISGNTTLNNCIVWGNTAATTAKQFDISDGTTTLNYCCYGNASGDVVVTSGTFAPDGNCITTDPKFTGTFLSAVYPYSITGISPCKNAGNNTYNSETYDVRGQVRIQDVTIDMGAYEWTNGIDIEQRIIYVDQAAGGSNNGTSWANAFTSFQSALNAATSSDEIWVAVGTYKPSQDYDLGDESNPRFYHFRMINGVKIYGGFAGNETLLSQRNITANETILSGDLNDNGTDDNDSYHVFYHPTALSLNSSAVLDGFTIKGGNANGPSHTTGGGMLNRTCSPTLINCTFKENSASSNGGGMYNFQLSTPTINNCKFTSNSANSGHGGGMYNSSSPTITDCSFTSNTANNGGGMYNNLTPALTISNCTFENNSASNNGGGMYNSGAFSSTALTNCTFNSNSAFMGGGMYNLNSSHSNTNCLFTTNSAEYGGGMSNNTSDTKLFNCLFTGNTASADGGGMYNSMSSSPTITNCTFTSNSGVVSGGGIYNTGSTPTFNNCILWGNTGDSGKQLFAQALSTITMNYSCYGNASGDVFIFGGTSFTPDANCITTDPKFVGAADNPAHPYSILGNSACVDAGNNAYISESYDIRGSSFPRKLNKLDGTAGTVDMGAYEYKFNVDLLPSEPVNPVPYIVTNTGCTVEEGGTFTFSDLFLKAGDDDGSTHTLTYSITEVPKHGTISSVFTQKDISDGKVTYIHDGGESRKDSLIFTVSDIDGNATEPQQFSIIINNVNDPPVILSIEDQIMEEDSSITILLSSTDVDTDSITYTAQSDTSAVTLTVSDTTLTLKGVANWNGQSNISVIANDGIDKDTTSFKLTITSVNDAPVIDSLANIQMNEEEIKEIIISANDVDGDSLTYSAICNDSSLSVNMIGNKLTMVPVKDWFGTSEITVTVSDTALSTNASFILEVLPVNDSPVLSNIETETLNYIIKGEGLGITSSLLITDIDDIELESAVISFDENYLKGEDKLIYAGQNGITGKWNMETGTMILTGEASIADYKLAITNVQYINSFITPTESVRKINIVVSDGDTLSNMVSREIIVTGQTTAPVLSNVESEPIKFVKGDDEKQISNTLMVWDSDNKYLFEGKVNFQEGFISDEDELIFENTTLITGNYEALSGSLILTGKATPEEYQNALRTVRYRNTKGVKAKTSTKRITFTVWDGQWTSNRASRTIEIISPLNSPTNLTIEINENGNAYLKWEDNSNNEDGFIILRSGKKEGLKIQTVSNYEIIDTVEADVTEYIDVSVVEGETYNYKVHGYTKEGLISDETVSNQCRAQIPLRGPSELKAVTNTDNHVELSWQDNSIAEECYIVERSTETMDDFKTITETLKDSVSYCDMDVEKNIKYYYRVYAIKDTLRSEFSNTVEIIVIISSIAEESIPREYKLYQNYPNPFNPTTTINFDIPKEGKYVLRVFNILGEVVSVLSDKEFAAGRYNATFDASNLSSGIYFYQLIGNEKNLIKKMLLVK